MRSGIVGYLIAVATACTLMMCTGEIIVREPPPVDQEEIITVAPGPAYVWIRGYWWYGPERHWGWRPGHWELAPRPRAVWEPGRWSRREGRDEWEWHEGRWR